MQKTFFLIAVTAAAAFLMASADASSSGYVPSAADPWGENIQPRLRVNYLSQKSGKMEKNLADKTANELLTTRRPLIIFSFSSSFFLSLLNLGTVAALCLSLNFGQVFGTILPLSEILALDQRRVLRRREIGLRGHFSADAQQDEAIQKWPINPSLGIAGE